jgi:hypothetical protein
VNRINRHKATILCMTLGLKYHLYIHIHTCDDTRSSMAPRSVSVGVRSRKLSNIGHWMGDQKYIMCFGKHVKPLVSAVFAVVSTHQPSRVVGYGPFSLWNKEGLCPSNGDINRLMMIHTYHSRFIPEGVAETFQVFLRLGKILDKMSVVSKWCLGQNNRITLFF